MSYYRSEAALDTITDMHYRLMRFDASEATQSEVIEFIESLYNDADEVVNGEDYSGE